MNSSVTHGVITVALPFPVILAGTFFNNRAISKVKADLKELRSAMERRFDRVDDHLTRLHSITGEHEGRLQAHEREA